MSTTSRESTLSIQRPHSFFVGGDWIEPSSGDLLSVISPVTEDVVMTFAEAKQADVDRAVAAARDAFDNGPWPRMSAAERAGGLREVAAHPDGAARRAGRGVDDPGRSADLVHELRDAARRLGLFEYYADVIEELRRSSTSAAATRAASCAS